MLVIGRGHCELELGLSMVYHFGAAKQLHAICYKTELNFGAAGKILKILFSNYYVSDRITVDSFKRWARPS
jgi:hypothetical protein